ncbi:hypothetical protein DERP_011741 [Dermatophagoides pteronyssinus]|uniref:RING-type domain-containing protein n=1 Tax=Dermatophagoides pteronyssinus TaxID=6956 RepID=A0ABQ8J3D5_DERPT|nr:hypothetical protein DERP_011741 [Dermatophagoides pteronyssinus]
MDFFLIFCDICYKSVPETKNQLTYFLTSCKNILCNNCHLSSEFLCPKCRQEHCRRIRMSNELKESIRIYFTIDSKHSIDIQQKIYPFQIQRFKRFEHFLLEKFKYHYSHSNESAIQLRKIENEKTNKISKKSSNQNKKQHPIDLFEFVTPKIPSNNNNIQYGTSIRKSRYDYGNKISNSTPLPGHEHCIDENIFFDRKPPSSIFSAITAHSRYRLRKN